MTSPIIRAATGATLALALILGACAGNDRPDLTIDASRDYAGPPIETGEAEDQHTLHVTVPTGGWEVRADDVVRRPMDNVIYLTLVRPDPGKMHTQALQRFDVTTGVDADEPLAVYAREVPHGGDPNDVAFTLARAIRPERR